MKPSILQTIEPFDALDNAGTLRKIVHQAQEIPLDSDRSRFEFRLHCDKLVLRTAAVEREFGDVIPWQCFLRLQIFAEQNHGLDYVQIFKIDQSKVNLWVIEDGQAITALLPSDY